MNIEIIKQAFAVGYAEEEGLIPLAETQTIIQAAQKSTNGAQQRNLTTLKSRLHRDALKYLPLSLPSYQV